MREGGQLQLFTVAVPGHCVGKAVAGFVHWIMLPDVSNTTMKYGRSGSGQSFGLLE
jgi:hypothetical protein